MMKVQDDKDHHHDGSKMDVIVANVDADGVEGGGGHGGRFNTMIDDDGNDGNDNDDQHMMDIDMTAHAATASTAAGTMWLTTDNSSSVAGSSDGISGGNNRKRRHMDSATTSDGNASTQPASTRTTSSFQIQTFQQLLERAENPNFEELARQYPDFRKAWNIVRRTQHSRGPHTTFSSCITQDFTVALTKALLWQIFNIQIPYLDDNHLCPPIPNRFFYIKWIYTELLNWADNQLQPQQQQQKSRSCYLGLDIGAGTSCIYSLLACSQAVRLATTTAIEVTKTTKMYTTEIDPYSYELACQNVKSNPSINDDDSSIQVLLVKPTYKQLLEQNHFQDHDMNDNDVDDNYPSAQSLIRCGPLRRALDAILMKKENDGTVMELDFCMTNPPFYDSSATTTTTSTESNISTTTIVEQPLEGNQRSRTNMTVSEGTYPGGEIGFVLDMFNDWLRLALSTTTTSSSLTSSLRPPRWCSAMIGKKTSFVYIQKVLIRVLGYGNVTATEYGPGQYTRWFVAWRTPSLSSSWTIRRTSDTTLLPRHPTKDEFVVTIDPADEDYEDDHDVREEQSAMIDNEDDNTRDLLLLQKVVRRIQQFCESNPGGWELTASSPPTDCGDDALDLRTHVVVTITERYPKPVVCYVDEGDDVLSQERDDIIPSEILDVLQQNTTGNENDDIGYGQQQQRQDWLPQEGHFLIDVHLRVGTGGGPSPPESPPVYVILTCYRHSTRGSKAVEKIRNTIEGEICRTNRKWRKIRQRRQQQQQIHQL